MFCNFFCYSIQVTKTRISNSESLIVLSRQNDPKKRVKKSLADYFLTSSLPPASISVLEF